MTTHYALFDLTQDPPEFVARWDGAEALANFTFAMHGGDSSLPAGDYLAWAAAEGLIRIDEVPALTDFHEAAARACCRACGADHLALLPCPSCRPCPCGSGIAIVNCDTHWLAEAIAPDPDPEVAAREELAGLTDELVAAGVARDLAARVAEGDHWYHELGDVPPTGV